ncbi:hypothetical protein DICPUDRAFT_84776 [Dictyostelium purpureum]|uniref:Uncharacterized protein n=1 Tax=Dictyostelium purpureum TaxID=5786 RepID=F1A3P9_DICPU|nr:uncharacterized protein DICPUDRAFT_84776 [Dictyostelium purpureum]EGC29183.1 hypothetical protein DICPUDRAFT_84776 [Dictyostelium purpureum]|eukprot:XP_003294291.1 hypothetical protein DICPUDRAFT_84776 [Dictyostelium purpureum]
MKIFKDIKTFHSYNINKITNLNNNYNKAFKVNSKYNNNVYNNITYDNNKNKSIFNNNNNITNNLYRNNFNLNYNNNNQNNSLNRYYSSNGLYKNKRILLNIFSSKSLTAFLIFCYFFPLGPVYFVVIPMFLIRMWEISYDTIKNNNFYEFSMIQVQKQRDKIQSVIGRPFQMPSIKECKFGFENNKSDEKKDNIIDNNSTTSQKKNKKNLINETKNKAIENFKKTMDEITNAQNEDHKNYMACRFDVLDFQKPGSKATIEVVCTYIPTTLKDIGREIPLDDKYKAQNINITFYPDEKKVIL